MKEEEAKIYDLKIKIMGLLTEAYPETGEQYLEILNVLSACIADCIISYAPKLEQNWNIARCVAIISQHIKDYYK